MRKFLSVFLVALWTVAAAAADAPIDDFERFIRSEMERQGIPGLSVALVTPELIWSNGFGFADLENRVRATEHSSYRMASVTKPMTAIAILELVEQGKVDLDAEVQVYVPSFPKKAYPVTIRQLLGHIGGISHYRNYEMEGRIREPKNTKEAIAIFQDFDLVAAPGTKYVYSTYGFNLLGAVIEAASGRTYGDFMREHVWRPMGMNATRMDDPREIITNRVRGYTFENGRLRNSEYVDISSRFAGGGTRSTVLDMLRLAREVGNVLKPETVDLMWTSLATSDGEKTGYGLGWSVSTVAGKFQVAHSGSQQETRTLASNLEEAALNRFANRAALIFLGDVWGMRPYVDNADDQKLVDQTSLLPDEIRKLRVDRRTRQKLERWAREWQALLTPEFVRANPEEVAESLRGRTIIPNFANELLNLAERRNDAQLAALVKELYPRWAAHEGIRKRIEAIR
jgi:CubicO group peptidase (beta-lactamase class C family)